MAGGEGVNVANAYVQIIPSAQGIKQNITDAIVPDLAAAGEQGGEVLGSGLLQTLQGSLGKIAAAVGAAFAAVEVGKFLEDVGAGFDEMHDSIVIGTGASGEALQELMGIAEEVATTVPVDFATAGDYIQDLNTRLGLTGEDLQDVATQLGALDSMIGAVNVETLSGAFAAWGVSSEDMASQMDYLFGVSQATGLGFDRLTGILESTAPAMQQMGFSFEETANMAGLLDRAGMDASGMMGKMSRALVEIAGEGGDAGAVFNDMIGEMQGYLDAGDRAAAMEIATQLFGTKGAAQFLQAVESGAMDMEAIRDAALGAGDGIMGTYEATASWSEQWDVLKNKAALAIEPLASGVFEALGTAIENLTATFDALAPAIQPIIDDLGAILVEQVMPALATAFETVSPIISDLGTVFLTVAGAVIGAVSSILSVVLPAFNNILSTATRVWAGVKNAIVNPINDAKKAVSDAINRIKQIFNTKLELPKFKLPHFNINGGEIPWGIGGKGRAPSISVDWYAKGGLVDGATLIGVGEQGAEMVWPSYEPYLSKYAAAIASSMPAGGGVTNVYLDNLRVNDDEAIRQDVINLVIDLGRYNRAMTAAR